MAENIAPSPWRRVRRVLVSRPVLVVAGAFVFYVVFGYFAVGPLLRHFLPQVVQSRLDSRASVRDVRFDPLRLTLTAEDFRLTTPRGQPLAGFHRLFVDFAPSGLFDWAWSFRRINLDQPQVDVAIARGGAMNWDGLVSALRRGAGSQKPSNTIVRLVIDQLQIKGGSLRLSDADRTVPYATRVGPLDVALSNLSTLPRDRGAYALSLQFPEQHATLRWKGYVGLNPLVSGGQAELTGLDLAAAARAVPGLDARLRITGGTAAVRAAYSAVLGESGLQWAVNELGVDVDALGATASGATLQLRQARLAQGRIDGSARTAAVQSLSVAGLTASRGSVAAALDSAQFRGASLDWGTMRAALQGVALQSLQARSGQARFDAAEATAGPATFDLRSTALDLPHLALRDGRLRPATGGQAPWLTLPSLRVDAVHADLGGRTIRIGSADLKAGDARMTRLADGRFDLLQALSANAGRAADPPAPKAPATATATAPTPTPTPAGWTIDLQRFKLALARLDYADRSFAQPLALRVGDIAADGGARVGIAPGQSPAVAVHGLTVGLGALALRSGDAELARWHQATLGATDVALQHGKPRVQAGIVRVDGLGADVQLGRDGLNWAHAFGPAPGAAVGPKPSPRAGASALPDVTVQGVELHDFSVHLLDSATPTPIRLDLVGGDAQAHKLSLDLRQPVPVSLRFAVQQGGRFDASGQIAPEPLRGKANLHLQGLALAPFGPLLQPYVRLLLTSGSASAAGTVQLAPGTKQPRITYAGTATVDNLALVEPAGRTPFLGWRRLTANGLSVDSAPLTVRVRDLAAVEPYGHVVLNPDRTLNVQAILLTRKPASPSPAPAAKPAAAASPAWSLRIDRTGIENADIDFEDQSIKPDFRVRMQKLSGVINGLSSAPDSSAQVALDGQVNDYGQASVHGRLQPFHAIGATDMTLRFRNLDMASVSPYSGKFAGRQIQSGRLDAVLRYRIHDGAMQGDNQFTLTRLRLGAHVDSPDAVNLPLDLAIAVLENSQGVIDIDLPVSGDLNNPKFSYGHIIWQAIVNVLTKVVTAPFRALGALLGGAGGQAPQDVHFAAGSAALAPPERETLQRLAEALIKRPRLELRVPPTSDPALDVAALQDAAVRRQVLQRLGVTSAADASPGPLDLADARTRNAVQALYIDHFPTSAMLALERSLPKTPQRPYALQHAMLEQVARTVTIPDAAVAALALARAQAVVAALTAGNPALPAVRVREAPPAVDSTATGRTVVLKLDLAPGAPLPSAPASAPQAASAPAVQGR